MKTNKMTQGVECIAMNLFYCDMCQIRHARKIIGMYDSRTYMGNWAGLCEEHFQQYGSGLGVGRGQKLVYPRRLIERFKEDKELENKEVDIPILIDDSKHFGVWKDDLSDVMMSEMSAEQLKQFADDWISSWAQGLVDEAGFEIDEARFRAKLDFEDYMGQEGYHSRDEEIAMRREREGSK